MTSFLSGCLDAPPEYRAPVPVPPVILTSLVAPDPTTTNFVSSDHEVIDLTVPFRSDDEGEGLLAYLVWDIPKLSTDLTNVVDTVEGTTDPDLLPSDLPFAEQGTKRALNYPWAWQTTPGLNQGCHTLTLILSHTTNFSHNYQLHDPLAAARLTWFFGLGDQATNCGFAGAP